MKRKPKLAPGSKWSRSNKDNTTVSDQNRDLTYIENGYLTLNDGESVQYSATDDALATIRAAKRDPVFDSAVALAEYWEGFSADDREYFAGRYQKLRQLLDANSEAITKTTE